MVDIQDIIEKIRQSKNELLIRNNIDYNKYDEEIDSLIKIPEVLKKSLIDYQDMQEELDFG